MSKLILRSILIILALAFISVGSTTAYFSDSAVISGNVFSTGSWSTIVINEVYYQSDKEWIELYNASDSTVDIKGWSICNSNNDCGKLNPNQKTDMQPKSYVLVSHDANDLKDWNVTKDITKIYYAGGKIEFTDTGDLVALKDVAGQVVDQMSYGLNTTAFNPSCQVVADSHTLERETPGLDTDKATDFRDQLDPTPGS